MRRNPANVMEKAVTSEFPISGLKLDGENVRLKHVKSAMSEPEIESYFWEEKQTKELYAQIRAARGLYQELVVTSNGVVKEGNRRLVCLRRLVKEAHAGELEGIPATQFDIVKCAVLPSDATETEISLLLATIHVRGKKAWDAFNKAEMLAHLHHDLGASYDTISAELGMAKVTIIRIVRAYESIKEYNGKYPDDSEWYRNFTCFDELFRRRTLRLWRDNPENMLQFFSWMHDKKISNHRQVRRLDRILETQQSRRIFDESGFDAAMTFLNSVDPTIQDSEFRRISNTIHTLQSFDRKSIIKIIEDPLRRKILENLRHEINSLLNDITALDRNVKKQEGENIENEAPVA